MEYIIFSVLFKEDSFVKFFQIISVFPGLKVDISNVGAIACRPIFGCFKSIWTDNFHAGFNIDPV